MVPVIFCVLSTLFHFSAVYLLPSLFFLFALERKKGNWVLNSKKVFAWGSILILVAVLCAYYLWSMNKFLLDIFVPLLHGRADSPGYTFFSLSHLLDILNQNLLLSPIGTILLISLLIVYKRKIRLSDQILIFLVVVFLTQFVYHALADPKFGAVKDWDLFSCVALGFILLGVCLFISLVVSKRYSALVLASTAFLSIVPWFLLNTSSEKAIDRLHNLLDLDPKRSYSGRQALIDYYFRQNMLTEVIQLRKATFKVFPEDSLNKEAIKNLDLGNLEKAEALANKAIELNPRFWYAYNNLALVYLKQGKVDQAIEIFKSILQTDPYQSIVRKNLAYALLDKGEFQEAAEELKKAISLGGAKAELLNNLAYIYWQSGEIQKAIEEFKKSIKMDPTFYIAYFSLGQLYLQNKYFDQALTEFQEVERLKPDYEPVYYHLGLVYADKGMKEKAIEEFDLFLKLNKNDAENQTVRGFIQQLRGQ